MERLIKLSEKWSQIIALGTRDGRILYPRGWVGGYNIHNVFRLLRFRLFHKPPFRFSVYALPSKLRAVVFNFQII
jgi:hypothetical protein